MSKHSKANRRAIVPDVVRSKQGAEKRAPLGILLGLAGLLVLLAGVFLIFRSKSRRAVDRPTPSSVR